MSEAEAAMRMEPMMFLVQARAVHSSMSVGTDRASTALVKLEELQQRGLSEAVVLDARGNAISPETLVELARDEPEA